MQIDDEQQLKQRLGIDSWRNVSRDTFIDFATVLPEVSDELGRRILAQFPDFKTLVLDSLVGLRDQAAEGTKANWRSQKKVHKAFAEYREMLTRELDRENLSSEDRFAVMRLFSMAVNDEALKDSEHKEFVLRALGMVATVGIVAVTAGAAVLSGRGGIGGRH
ncbi:MULTISPECIES: hypothetical protein [unclassified Rathayibacter]|uniref:hypothetical protein n=1 Tax=unclassified Rathayibacter TaxID=2609250 RepID=UPI0006F3165F|nr:MULTISPECIES: hypothetical protein [unclassified Rathayibacter]KQP97656.1 hypothetical protein ASF42_18550 [Rathayibacter sp. Leaf294]KQS07328.1 hypothetical protein ASG06_19285 [Rathayibacter sp. Leaf185]